MDKEIVVVVPTEKAAYEVVKSLKSLDNEGSIELYAFTVAFKTKEGKLDVKARETPHLRTPGATAVGIPTGALIGLIGGPVGAAIGAAAGGAAGLNVDMAYSGFAGGFIHEVAVQLKPESWAVIASINEDWTMPVNSAVEPLGGVLLRQKTDDFVLVQLRSAMQQLDEEMIHIDGEIERAIGDAKKKLEAKRDELRAKQAAEKKRLQDRAKELAASWNAKIESINASIESAKAEAKARHQQHKDKLAKFAATQKKAFAELFA
jgi:uncharacterized membrane protein